MKFMLRSRRITDEHRLALLGVGLFVYQANMSLVRAVGGNSIAEMRLFYRDKTNPREIAEKIAFVNYDAVLVDLNGGYLRHWFSKHALRSQDFSFLARLLFDFAALLEGEAQQPSDAGNLRWCFALLEKKFCRVPPGMKQQAFSQVDFFYRPDIAPTACQIEDIVGKNWISNIPGRF